ncbi:hypothetical protein DFS34DRAFT_590719 [Phlyctochytrium arcticum]|nr:hypothetical protein DFS34DRAFT_590719 [Phlyctochytrium arcticum]
MHFAKVATIFSALVGLVASAPILPTTTICGTDEIRIPELKDYMIGFNAGVSLTSDDFTSVRNTILSAPIRGSICEEYTQEDQAVMRVVMYHELVDTLLQAPTISYVVPVASGISRREITIPELQTYIVTFNKQLSATEAASFESLINARGKLINRLELINGAVVRWNMNNVDELKNMAGVATVEKDGKVSINHPREISIPELQTYIITFSKELSATESATMESLINARGKLVNRLSIINGAVVRWNMNNIDELKNLPGVATVEKDEKVSIKRPREITIPELQTYIITFANELSAAEAATIESLINARGKIINRLSLINGAVVRWDMNFVDDLKNIPGVASVEKDSEVTINN